ncbi:MAG: YkgJ family cysteine cluster protein [Deltaproteobacteria bacterium]|nr:YkgJ family cysteine cluster protein [Deltaproteobacteria bacterium]
MGSQNACTRCGKCCLQSSPSLQLKDLHLIQNHIIPKSHLYSIREGELVKDNIHNQLIITQEEMIKIKEKPGSDRGCIYYGDAQKACRIYPNRPSQCAALKCWDPNDFEKVYSGPKLTRSHIIANNVILGIMTEHERRCSYKTLDELIKMIETEGDQVLQEILNILRFDYELRPFISKKLDLDPEEMDLYFGRPLVNTIVMHGLEVRQESDGGFLLTKKEG